LAEETRGTLAAVLAAKGDQHLVLAVKAANASKTSLQTPHLRKAASQKAVRRKKPNFREICNRFINTVW